MEDIIRKIQGTGEESRVSKIEDVVFSPKTACENNYGSIPKITNLNPPPPPTDLDWVSAHISAVDFIPLPSYKDKLKNCFVK